jgi:hypothetical protein
MHSFRSFELNNIATVIFIGFLSAKLYANDFGKYSIENLSAGNPEAASIFTN